MSSSKGIKSINDPDYEDRSLEMNLIDLKEVNKNKYESEVNYIFSYFCFLLY